MWAAFYYIGIWNVLEPMITFFGFSNATIEILRNLGIALFPLVVIIVWFHGEPGTQKFTVLEAGVILLGLIFSGSLFYRLTRTPPQEYSVILPISNQQRSWYRQHIFREFEKKHKVKLHLESFEENYEDQLFNALHASGDSSRILLAEVPLQYTGVLLNENKDLLISFDDVVERLGMDHADLDDITENMTPYLNRFGQKPTSSRELYFMPAEYETMVLVYSKERVEWAVREWQNHRKEIDSAFYELAQKPLPVDYHLEPDPNLWDSYDLFVVGWCWANESYENGTEKGGKIATPSFKNMQMFTYLLNRALSHGATLDKVLNLPYKRDVFPPDAIADMYYWESLFRRGGLYNRRMLYEEGLGQPEIGDLLKNRITYMAYVTTRGISDLIKSDPDLQVATMPAGISAEGELSAQKGFSNAWFWAIPRKSESYGLSYKLVEWLVSAGNQKKISDEFLWPPVRTDVLASLQSDSSEKSYWQSMMKQLEIDQRAETEINPYKHFTRAGFEVLLNFYYLKWRTIVKGDGFMTIRSQFDKKNIVALLML